VAVVRIERRVFEEPWRLSAFEQFLDSPGFLVMEDPAGGGLGEELAGYVVSEVMTVRGTEVGHVKDLGVKPERQGEGRGRALLERALGVLATEGATVAKLEVRPSNERAIELYRQFGFAIRQRRERYYPDGEDALILARQLGDRERF
jgi:ribosomal-protein-alanine N-acetyltransferase